jgi:hypothetical protein
MAQRTFCDACEKPIPEEAFAASRSKPDCAIRVQVNVMTYQGKAEACSRACVPGAVDKARVMAMGLLEAVELAADIKIPRHA